MSPLEPKRPQNIPKSVETFQFHDAFLEDSNNGLYLNDIYVPEEVISMILTYVDFRHILKCSEVCKKWCNIIKSQAFWAHLYQERYRKRPKKVPWYVYYCLFTTNYFDTNLIKNGNGQEQYNHWKVIKFDAHDGFQIEDPPIGANPLPANIPEFDGNTSCFASCFDSFFYDSYKKQIISFQSNKLMQLIFDKHKPQIYLSEWYSGRVDCYCIYSLCCLLYGPRKQKRRRRKRQGNSNLCRNDVALHMEKRVLRVEKEVGSEWSKAELLVKDYPDGVARIVFMDSGMENPQGWAGYNDGSKMAGGVLKILFDSIVEDGDEQM